MNIAGQKKRGKPRSLLLVAATAVSIIVLMACSYNHHTSTDAPKEYRTKTGKTIIILETHPVGQSLSTIEVRTEGFEHNFGEIFEDRVPISDVFVADLDGNGFDEIYIITTSAGSGSYGTVLGFASNKDKSLSIIHFPERREGNEHFEGYMGHDSFGIEDGKLLRIFPLYNQGDTNENPTGGRRKLVYGLYPGEAMWQLKVEEAEDLTVCTNEVEILQSWQGDFPVNRLELLPEKQREQAVGFIGDAETFGDVWKAFKPGEAVPEIDFQADLVLFARNTHFYNSIRIGKVNVQNGVAEVLAMETMSAMPIEDQVAISLVVVPRKGIKSIRETNSCCRQCPMPLCIAMMLVSCMKQVSPSPGAQTAGIEGIQWYLVEVGGSPVSPMADDKQPHMMLDPEEKQVTGFAGCNHFFGRYELDGSSLTFGPMGATRMACPDLETGLEASVFEALESTRKWKKADGELLLLDGDEVLARFSREKYMGIRKRVWLQECV